MYLLENRNCPWQWKFRPNLHDLQLNNVEHMKDLDCTVFTFLEERKTDATVSILSSQRFYFSQGTSIMIQTNNTAIIAAKGKYFQMNCRVYAFSWEGSD